MYEGHGKGIGKGSLKKTTIINLADDKTPWDCSGTDFFKYSEEDTCANAVRAIVNLDDTLNDTANRLAANLQALVLAYFALLYAKFESDLSKFGNQTTKKAEVRKLTMVFMSERLKHDPEARTLFNKQYKERPSCLSTVPKCHHRWRYSAQEANKVYDICFLISTCYEKKKKVIRPYVYDQCLNAANSILEDRKKKKASDVDEDNVKRKKLITCLKGLRSLGLLVVEMKDIEDGLAEDTSLKDIFGDKFVDEFNGIINP
jgi:hypothetical protein